MPTGVVADQHNVHHYWVPMKARTAPFARWHHVMPGETGLYPVDIPATNQLKPNPYLEVSQAEHVTVQQVFKLVAYVRCLPLI